jgi:hypothetical protein
MGFAWYARVGDDYMNFRLDAEERLGETSVLVIRREGRFTVWLPEEATLPEGEPKTIPVVMERKGITLLAWKRSVVLEDRLMDSLVEAGGPLAYGVGTTRQVVTRLIRSCPVKT